MKPGKLQRAGLLFRFLGWIAPSRDIDRAHAKRSFQNNMADTDDFFFFGDDFDAILGILEEEEELDEQFREAAGEVSITFFLSHPHFSEKRCALTFYFFELDRLYISYRRVSSVLLFCCDLCYN